MLNPADHPRRSQERAMAAAALIREVLPTAVIGVRHDPGLATIGPHYFIEVDP